MKRTTRKILTVLLILAVVLSATALTACGLLGGGLGEYTVVFVADGQFVGTRTYTADDMRIAPPAVPEKTGYNGAWEEYTLNKKNITVNAVYTAKTYTVYLNYDGGTFDDPSQVITVTYDQPVDNLPTTTKEGYTFVGWYYGENLVEANSLWKIDGDYIVLVAKWYRPTTYTVNFYADGKFVDSRTYTSDNNVIDEPQVPAKKGYNGVWEEYTLTSGNVTVNAVYTAKTYTVALNYDGATGGNEQRAVTATFDESIGELPTPNKDGYKFLGWYIDGTKLSANFTKWQWDGDSLTLTAMWWDRSLGSLGLKFELNADNSSYTVTGIAYQTNDDTDLDIPSYHNGLPVTAIKASAFVQDRLVKAVYIGDNVTTIGLNAFYSCPNLESVVIGNSVVLIGAFAFCDCAKLSEIMIPDSVTTIDKYAFDSCSSLASVTLGSGVTTIGNNAFDNCQITSAYYRGNLVSWCKISFGNISSTPLRSNVDFYIDGQLVTDVEIPNNITKLKDYAFAGCSLTSVTIPSSVTSIGVSAFDSCNRLKSITFTNKLTTIGSSAFNNCTSLSNVYYMGDVTDWCALSFDSAAANPMNHGAKLYFNNQLVTNLEIPASIATVGDYAFYGCYSLISLVIPDSTKAISKGAFFGCVYLEDVTIGNGVTTIGDDAFCNCRSVTNLTIGNSVESIGYRAFGNCRALTSVTIPNSVTEIGNNAFGACTDLLEITLPNNLTAIGDSTFTNCTSLTSIVIPDGITSIGEYAFFHCISLASVTLPNGLATIGDRAFFVCYALESVYYGGGVADWCAINFASSTANPLTYGANLYISSLPVTQLEIPSSVTTVCDYAFVNCASITSVTIPDSVTEIGLSAFAGCSNLISATLGNGLTTLGNSIFSNCENLVNISLPNSLTKIDSTAFDGCSSIKYTAYDNALYLGNSSNNYLVLMSATDTSITSCAMHEQTRLVAPAAFSGCSSLTKLYVSDNIIYIADDALNGCSSLTYNYASSAYFLGSKSNSFVVLINVAPLNESEFTALVIPENTRIIMPNACRNHTNLQSVTIRDNLVYIGSNAFYGCTRITTVNFTGTQAQWGAVEKGTNWNYGFESVEVSCANG